MKTASLARGQREKERKQASEGEVMGYMSDSECFQIWCEYYKLYCDICFQYVGMFMKTAMQIVMFHCVFDLGLASHKQC